MSLDILHEDNHLLVVAKPAGIPVQPDASGDSSLFELAKDYRKNKEHKPGNVFIGIVHRLDRPVSGVLLLAKTSKAASRLSAQFRQRTVQKTYLAVVHAPSPQDPKTTAQSGVWEDQLIKNTASNRVQVAAKSQVNNPGQAARTEWRLLKRAHTFWLLELSPYTGRPHQLRVQAASRQMPIVGDKKYGSLHSFDQNLALHAFKLLFRHPTRNENLEITCPPPKSWSRFPFPFPKKRKIRTIPIDTNSDQPPR